MSDHVDGPRPREVPMTVRTTMPIASRRSFGWTFARLGGGLLAAALSASTQGAGSPGLPAVPAPGETRT